MSKNLPEYSQFHLAGLFWGFSDSNEMVSEVLGYYPCKIYAVLIPYETSLQTTAALGRIPPPPPLRTHVFLFLTFASDFRNCNHGNGICIHEFQISCYEERNKENLLWCVALDETKAIFV